MKSEEELEIEKEIAEIKEQERIDKKREELKKLRSKRSLFTKIRKGFERL